MRRTISAPYREFRLEISRLERLDDENQARLSTNRTRPEPGSISKKQLFLLNEGVFFSAYRGYENFIEDVFLLYGIRKKNISGKSAKPYLNTTDFARCRKMIKGGSRFLDWTDPDAIISRSDLFFQQGEPIKPVVSANKNILQEMKWVRNHIAHNSQESRGQYVTVLRRNLRTLPLNIPSVGEFLNMTIAPRSSDYYLRQYMSVLSTVAYDLVH